MNEEHIRIDGDHANVISNSPGASINIQKPDGERPASCSKESRAETAESDSRDDTSPLSEEERKELNSYAWSKEILAASRSMLELFRKIERVVKSEHRVLILGESGTGKELVAKALHEYGPRTGKEYKAVNMASISATMMESELFGHEKGAFTGAASMRRGMFELADGGTLFLDEIGDMSPELQVRMLRVLETGKFPRMGGEKNVEVNVRVISATHQPLEEMCEEKSFREDLYHRLSVVILKIPSLNERKEDIPFLASHFIRKETPDDKKEKVNITPNAITVLKEHDWKGGNVRQLSNVMERSCLESGKSIVMANHVRAALNLETVEGEVDISHVDDPRIHDIIARLRRIPLGTVGNRLEEATRDTDYPYKSAWRWFDNASLDPSDFHPGDGHQEPSN